MEGVKDDLQVVGDAHLVVDRPKVFLESLLGNGELARNLQVIPTMHDVVDNGLFRSRQGIRKWGRALRAGFPDLCHLGHALPWPPNLAIHNIVNTLFRDFQFVVGAHLKT